MADSGRTVFGGTPAAGLRVPPASELGVPLATSDAIPLTAPQFGILVWDNNDDTGDPFPAGAVEFADQQFTLDADHQVLQVADAWVRVSISVGLTAGAGGATLSVSTLDDRHHIILAADESFSLHVEKVMCGAAFNLGVIVDCLVGSVTIGYSTLYAHRLN